MTLIKMLEDSITKSYELNQYLTTETSQATYYKTNLIHGIHLLVHLLMSFLVQWSHSGLVYPETITKYRYD